MEELFLLAENESKKLKHPYVGTEHFMLAYLSKYSNNYISYDLFKEYIIDIIGCSSIVSDYKLYTPILRNIKNTCNNVYSAMVSILTDDDSIAYNILLSKGIDVESVYLDVIHMI